MHSAGDVVVRRIPAHVLVRGNVFGVAPLLVLDHRERQAWVEHGGETVDERDLSNNCSAQIGAEVYHGSHEQSTGAGAADRQAFAGREVLRNQVVGASAKVSEGVALVEQLAVLIPASPQFAAATNVGDRENEAAIKQAQPLRAEGGVDGVLVGTVSVEQRRRRAVQRNVAPVNVRDGYSR